MQVDVDPKKVMGEDRIRDRLNARHRGMGRPTRFTRMLQLLAVHGGKEVESHQSNVHRTAGGIEQGQLTHRFERQRGNHANQRHEVATLLRQATLRVHLEPVAPEAILNEEAHDPARSEELGRNG